MKTSLIFILRVIGVMLGVAVLLPIVLLLSAIIIPCLLITASVYLLIGWVEWSFFW